MKKIFTLPFILVSLTMNAQLLNGSFEDDGSAPSLANWQHTCGDPVSFADAAPGWGLWCVEKQYGNTQGCFPSYVYQTLPDMDDGEIWTLSGWARRDSMYVGTQFGVVLGKKDQFESIHLFEGNQTASASWTFLSITDTIQLSAGDTGAVVLSAGLVGGPMFGLAYFDGIELVDNSTVGINEEGQGRLSLYPSPAYNELYIGSSGFNDRVDLNVYDLTGKLVLSQSGLTPQNETTIRLDVAGLTTGTYLVQLIDGNKALTARFYKK